MFPSFNTSTVIVFFTALAILHPRSVIDLLTFIIAFIFSTLLGELIWKEVERKP
jgi:hypothetical protein